MHNVLSAKPAKLLKLKLTLNELVIFACPIVNAITIGTFQFYKDFFTHEVKKRPVEDLYSPPLPARYYCFL